MAKLPKEIDLATINNGTFVYQDPVEMIEDIKRLRRKTGWTTIPASHSPITAFHVVDVDQLDNERFAHFQIELRIVHQLLWTSLYPANPSVHQLRRWWLSTANGLDRIANMVNAIPKNEEPLPDEASAWHRLMHDEDPF